ncbi:MAG: LLM class flavin-dependent oxidoreductase [Alphaproteobacteria bacterium]
MALKLSVLDQAPVSAGSDMASAVNETIALAKATEALGYHRYWVAEHHNTRSFASTAPEILIARLAAETSRMRIGSGGVMMTHYSPLKVAETFRMLEAMYPGRIDLGMGRAPGGDARTTAALQAGPQKFSIDAFPAQVELTADYLANNIGEGHPLNGIVANPTGNTTPDIWLLGSTQASAGLAAKMGHAFSFAHFINADQAADAFATYRMYFEPSAQRPAPETSVGIFALACDTEEEAARQAKTRNLWVLNFLTGKGGPFPTLAEAEAFMPTDEEKEILAGIEGRGIVGTKEQVKEQIDALAASLSVEEVMIVTITHDPAVRTRSYELLADAYNLT